MDASYEPYGPFNGETVPTDREMGQPFLSYKQLLGERLYLYSVARFLVVVGIAAGAVAARHFLRLEGLDVYRLLGVAAVLALYNVLVFAMVRPYRNPDRAAGSYLLLTGMAHGTILLDFVFLTISLWLVGGSRSPFQAFYLFHVIIASVLLSRTAAFTFASLGYLFLTGLVIAEWREWIPSCYPHLYAEAGPINGQHVLTVLVVYGLLFALSAWILTNLMQTLRRGEREVRNANAKLEHLSAMRRDFLHIALHDLKSPVVAVSQHLRNLETHLADRLSDQERHWLERCRIRLKEQLDFLHDLDILASLESEGIRNHAKDVDVNGVLAAVVAENQDLARMHEQRLQFEPPNGVLPPVVGIERLLREAVVNLVTNAIKYTMKGGSVTVRARSSGERLRIEVEDTGIGIAPKDQERLFREFVRLRRRDVSLEPEVSSGLGLSIVRRVAEAHGGTVGVVSEVNRGSTFYVELPIRLY